MPYKDKEKEREHRKGRQQKWYYSHLEKVRQKKREAMRRFRRLHPLRHVANVYGISEAEVIRLRSSPCGIRECKNKDVMIDHERKCPNCGFYNTRTGLQTTKCVKCGIRLPIRGTLCRRHNSFAGFIDTATKGELRSVMAWTGMGVE